MLGYPFLPSGKEAGAGLTPRANIHLRAGMQGGPVGTGAWHLPIPPTLPPPP